MGMCTCNSNPCRDPQNPESIPVTTLLATYESTALSHLLPPEVRITAAKSFYDLLTHGNHNDARTWYVGQKKAEQNKILNDKKPISTKDVAYTGTLEVFPH